MRRGRRRPGGFTLTELIVVMVIMVIAASVIMPTFMRQLEYARLSSAARRLLSCARYARSQAVIRNVPYRLNIDEEGRRYWITCYDADRAELGEEPFRTDTSTLGLVEELPEDVTFEQVVIGDERREGEESAAEQVNPDGSIFVEYRPDGTSDGMQVLLKNAEDERLAIRADAVTGRAEIAEEAEE